MNAVAALGGLGRTGLFLIEALAGVCRPPLRPRAVAAQIAFVGARSVLVILLSGAFVGMVVALQFHDTLVRFGSVGLIGAAVGLSLIRELGPVICALMVIGRAGSSLCAELAVMRSEEQVDALETMGIAPVPFLVSPRLLAGLLSLPLLTAMFDVAGILGGWFVAVVLFGISEGAYFGGMLDAVRPADVFMGFCKAAVFALVLTTICTAKGFHMHLHLRGQHGSEGVSVVTTEAVVYSAIAVLAADFLISALLV